MFADPSLILSAPKMAETDRTANLSWRFFKSSFKKRFFFFFLLCSEWLSLSFQLLFCYCHRVGETIWLTSVFHLPLSVFFSISPVAFWCALHDLIALTLVFLSTKNLYFSPLPLIRVWWKFKVRFTSSDTFWPLIRVFVLVLGESEFL